MHGDITWAMDMAWIHFGLAIMAQYGRVQEKK